MGWNDDDDVTPREIQQAVERHDLDEVKRLFEERPEFLRDADGLDIWLNNASWGGDLPLVKLLVDLGIGVNEPHDKELPEGPMGGAAAEGHIHVVQWFLDHGVNVNHVYKGRRRSMPLMSAAWRGHLEVVKLLCAHGADIHASWHCMNALTGC